MLQLKSFDILLLLIRGKGVIKEEYYLNLLCQSLPSLSCTAVTSHAACSVEFTSQTFKGEAAQFSCLFPVLEKACQFSVLQKPHESLMTHIKQLDRHREHVGCTANLVVATWMDRLQRSKNHTYVQLVKLSGLQEYDFILKIPKQQRRYGANMICFLWYLRDDWSAILPSLFEALLCFM